MVRGGALVQFSLLPPIHHPGPAARLEVLPSSSALHLPFACRLLADDSPRARALLKDMLYGPGRTRLDIDRLTRLADAFSSFTTDGLIAGNSSGNSGSVMAASASQPASAPASPETAAGGGGVSQQGTPVLALASASAAGNGRSQALSQPQGQGQGVLVDPVVREVLLVVFSRKGTYIQVGRGAQQDIMRVWGGGVGGRDSSQLRRGAGSSSCAPLPCPYAGVVFTLT